MTKKYKPITVYVAPSQHKKLIKKIGTQAFSRWVREKIKEELK